MLGGDVPLDDSGVLKVSQASYDHVRPYWDSIGVTVVGRHVFDLTDGWQGVPLSGDEHVVVVTHRPAPEGWNPTALVNEVRMDVAAVGFGSGRRCFGSVDGQQLLQNPSDVIQGDRVLHLRYEVRR